MALRLIPFSSAISRELRICSPKGAWRFFRIGDESVTELGTNGEPLTPGTARIAGYRGKYPAYLYGCPPHVRSPSRGWVLCRRDLSSQTLKEYK
jgi:hypothetical protein